MKVVGGPFTWEHLQSARARAHTHTHTHTQTDIHTDIEEGSANLQASMPRDRLLSESVCPGISLQDPHMPYDIPDSHRPLSPGVISVTGGRRRRLLLPLGHTGHSAFDCGWALLGIRVAKMRSKAQCVGCPERTEHNNNRLCQRALPCRITTFSRPTFCAYDDVQIIQTLRIFRIFLPTGSVREIETGTIRHSAW